VAQRCGLDPGWDAYPRLVVTVAAAAMRVAVDHAIAVGDTADPNYRTILRHVSLYQKAVQTGLPFPKTRRIVFQGGQPAYLPGWVVLEIN